MPETPESHASIKKIQKDIEELKENQQNNWHLNKEKYISLIKKVLEGNESRILLFLEIDGFRSLSEIIKDSFLSQYQLSQPTLWRASQKLVKGGLIKKVNMKSRSPVYQWKPWIEVLNLDDYVRKNFLLEEKKDEN